MSTICLALLVRVIIALSTRTFFQPDEYFQSLEPAYHAVFGYAHLTWEWLGKNPIRSILYPAVNIPVYWALKVSGLAEVPSIGDRLVVATRLMPLAAKSLTRCRFIVHEYYMEHLPLLPTYGSVKLSNDGSAVDMYLRQYGSFNFLQPIY